MSVPKTEIQLANTAFRYAKEALEAMLGVVILKPDAEAFTMKERAIIYGISQAVWRATQGSVETNQEKDR